MKRSASASNGCPAKRRQRDVWAVPLPRQIQIGSFCTGSGISDRELGKSLHRLHNHRFTCDKSHHCRALIAANLVVDIQYTDTATAYRDAPDSDIFFSGFPCQPFSNSGVGGALSDDRGCVILHIIMYLKRVMPRIFILENVPGLLTHHGEVFAAILEQLKALKDRFGDRYFVSWRLLNSMRHGGVPQNRERIYIVGIKRCHRRLTFAWPDEIPCIPLSDMWDTDRVALRTYRRYPFPTLVVPEKCVMNAMTKILNKAEEDGEKPHSYDVIVDIGTSSSSVGFGHSPTLTRSRCLCMDYWSMRHASKLTLSEMMRLQGFPDDVVIPRNVTRNQMAGMVGDAFTIPLAQRVLKAAVQAAECLDQ